MTNASTVWKLYRRTRAISPLDAERIWTDYYENRVGSQETCRRFRGILFVGAPA